MKYLLLLLLLGGSVWAWPDCSETHVYHENCYLDTVEVCDTVWYYTAQGIMVDSCGTFYRGGDSLSEINCRDAFIYKQKKQIWLTENEYDELMRLLNWRFLQSIDTAQYLPKLISVRGIGTAQ